MKFEANNFYKYIGGLNSPELIINAVYWCTSAINVANDFWYVTLVDELGNSLSFHTYSKSFRKSGIIRENWIQKNTTTKRNVQHSPLPLEKVNHPSHYTWLKDLCGIEVIDITRHMDFDLGNAIKYILRCGHKPEEGYTEKEKMIEDLQKAIFYINDKINQLK